MSDLQPCKCGGHAEMISGKSMHGTSYRLRCPKCGFQAMLRWEKFQAESAWNDTMRPAPSKCRYCDQSGNLRIVDGAWIVRCGTCGCETGPQLTEADAWAAWERVMG